MKKKTNFKQSFTLPKVKYFIAVASGKGGVGKSTTSVNLALAFKELGYKVAILDGDVYGPSMPRMLGLDIDYENRELKTHQAYGIDVMSMGCLVPEEQPMVWRGPMVMGAIQQMLNDVAWPEVDVMVIDLPPGTGDAQLTLSQKVPLDGVVIVSTPQDISLIDARKGLKMFEKVAVPIYGIVENMSYFSCPHCNEKTHIFDHGGAKREAEKLGVPFLGEIPLDIKIRETSDQGAPIVVSDPENDLAKSYINIAKKVSKNFKKK